MAKTNGDPIADKLDALIRVTQDLLILQALQAGINVSGVRKIARVNTDRVTAISRHLKGSKGS